MSTGRYSTKNGSTTLARRRGKPHSTGICTRDKQRSGDKEWSITGHMVKWHMTGHPCQSVPDNERGGWVRLPPEYETNTYMAPIVRPGIRLCSEDPIAIISKFGELWTGLVSPYKACKGRNIVFSHLYMQGLTTDLERRNLLARSTLPCGLARLQVMRTREKARNSSVAHLAGIGSPVIPVRPLSELQCALKGERPIDVSGADADGPGALRVSPRFSLKTIL
ncbi:hypothetical protein K474DRAFT_1680777 [Panus rudis PR-1116 ss-1]|nr:hypothetical protein K474DRAFT_1680777 [Panus rudis PR-1116 ss-1]